jgi:hypothetical protein
VTAPSLARAARRRVRRLARAGVERGVPPAWFGYRAVPRETLPAYVGRHRGDPAVRCETVHPPAVARNPLPRTVASADELPADRGWWGYSFRDVPRRASGQTLLATLPDSRITAYLEPVKGDYYPAVLTDDGRALDLREVRFRPGHAAALRRGRSPVRLERATWVLERVYHNHSHWLTAHLPKLLLLRDRDALADVVLPSELTPAMDGSLRMLGLDPDAFRRVDPTRPLEVGELTLLDTDRFRPELLRSVQAAYAVPGPAPHRRVYISRARAARRRLLGEDELWSLLERHGFERVVMEELAFAEQVALMRETAVLLAPHGAGLTNMVFCPPGAHVVELADLSFPNPNFYALAAALGHPYWLLPATPVGSGHPLERDLRVDPDAVARVLPGLLAG